MRIVEESIDILKEYGQVSIAFEVKTIFQVKSPNDGFNDFIEKTVDVPWIKDYDSIEGPVRWVKQWDISNWGIFSVYKNKLRVGGACVAYDTKGVNFLDGRKDLTALWDIRLNPEFRRQGIGSNLFQKAVEWSQNKGCCQMKIETQNNNVPACRFYAKHECRLGEINFHAYKGFPEEIMLVWYKSI
ncbi:GNAT family N-acetyltransferase [bacterium]|nr:GNAT family N-acetyltransferase [bacterium]